MVVKQSAYDGFTNVSDGLESGDSQIDVVCIVNKRQEEVDEIWPLLVGEFNGGDRSEDLGSNGANPAGLGSKGGEDILLYFCLVLFWSVLPPESGFICTCLFLQPKCEGDQPQQRP